MPLFAADNFEISLFLDSPHFYVGSNISGRLQIVCNEKTSIRGLVLIYKTTMQEAREDPNDIKPIFEMVIVLVGSRHGHSMDIPAGEYCYPFTIPISTSLPPSCFLSDVVKKDRRVCHWLCAAVIIARGLKDFCRTFPVTVLKAAHPTAIASQKSVTRFHDAPSLFLGGCLPSVAKYIPGSLRAERNSFQVTVKNPLVVLDSNPTIDVTVTATALLHPMQVCFCRRTVLALPDEQHHVHRRDRVLLQSVLHTDWGRDVTNVNATFQLRVPVQPADPPSFMVSGVFVTYYLVIRLDYNDDCGKRTCCVGVLPEDEARIPITVVHSINDQAPLSNTMSWLPSKTAVHAAPQWASSNTSEGSEDSDQGMVRGTNAPNDRTSTMPRVSRNPSSSEFTGAGPSQNHPTSHVPLSNSFHSSSSSFISSIHSRNGGGGNAGNQQPVASASSSLPAHHLPVLSTSSALHPADHRSRSAAFSDAQQQQQEQEEEELNSGLHRSPQEEVPSSSSRPNAAQMT